MKRLAWAGSGDRSLPYAWILVLLIVLLNLNTTRNGFTLDERDLLENDPRIVSLSHIGDIFSGKGAPAGLYRPMTVLSLALNRIRGADPLPFHIAGVLLHLLAALLVLRLSAEVLENRFLGFLAAVLFAVHPSHVEVSAGIVGRAEVLEAISILACLWIFMRRRGAALSRAWPSSIILFLLYSAGLMSKESALVLLGLWVLFGLYFNSEESFGARCRSAVSDYRLWGLLALSLLYWGVRHSVLTSVVPASQPGITYLENPLAFEPVPTRILTALALTARYIRLLVWPFRLSADYSFNAIPLISKAATMGFLASLGLLAGLGIASALLARKRPVYLLSYFFFLVSISAVSNLLIPAERMMAERFLYLPSLAFFWALVQAMNEAGWFVGLTEDSPRLTAYSARSLAVILICLIVPWGMKTYLRNAQWKNDRTLFAASLLAAPESARSHAIMGDIHLQDLDYRAAERQYRRALDIYPQHASAAINLASICNMTSRYPEALELLKRFEGQGGASELNRLRQAARAYVGVNDFPRAAEAYEAVLQRAETDAAAHRDLGSLYLYFLNQPGKGRAHFRRSLELDPTQRDGDQLRSILEPR